MSKTFPWCLVSPLPTRQCVLKEKIISDASIFTIFIIYLTKVTIENIQSLNDTYATMHPGVFNVCYNPLTIHSLSSNIAIHSTGTMKLQCPSCKLETK